MDQKRTNQLLEEIKKLLVLVLVEQGIQGKRIAEVLNVDPAIVSRIVTSKRRDKKNRKE